MNDGEINSVGRVPFTCRLRYSNGWLSPPRRSWSWPWRKHLAKLRRWRCRREISHLLRRRQTLRLEWCLVAVMEDDVAAERVVELLGGGGMQAGREHARRLRRLANQPSAEGRPPIEPALSSGSSNSNCVIDWTASTFMRKETSTI